MQFARNANCIAAAPCAKPCKGPAKAGPLRAKLEVRTPFLNPAGQPLDVRRIKVLVNTGSGSQQDKAALSKSIISAFATHGIAAEPEFIDGGSLREKLKSSIGADELDAVIVGGGDGTLKTAASVLAGGNVPLGILPLGTLNHFAKDLEIPLELDEAVAVIASGHVEQVDIGDVNGATFINNSSIGIYPYIVLNRERRRREGKLSKWPAMIMATVKVFRNLPLRRLRIQRQGATEIFRSPCVFIGNNNYHSSDASAGSRASLREGKLYLYVAKRQSRLALFILGLRVITGRLNQSRDMRIMPVSEVVIKSGRRRLLIACDGEVEILATPLEYKIRPLALKVLTPPARA